MNANEKSKLFENRHQMVRKGYLEFALDLISNIQKTLKADDDLNASQREFLIDCFENLLETGNANTAFYLKKTTKGAPKKAVGMRNLQIGILMDHADFADLSYEDKLVAVRDRINQSFGDSIDTKTVAAAYTQYNSDSIKFEEDL